MKSPDGKGASPRATAMAPAWCRKKAQWRAVVSEKRGSRSEVSKSSRVLAHRSSCALQAFSAVEDSTMQFASM